MKKTAIIAISTVLLCAVAACGNTEQGGQTDNQTTNNPSEQTTSAVFYTQEQITESPILTTQNPDETTTSAPTNSYG